MVGASCSGNNIKTEKTTTFKVDRAKILFPEVYCPDNWMVVAGTITANGAYTCEPKPIKASPKVCATKHAWFDEGKLIGCRQLVY